MKKRDMELSPHAVRHDAFDQVAFEDIYSQSKELQDISEKGVKVLKTFAELTADVFYALYKANPELIAPEEMLPEYSLNHAQMEKLIESPSFQELRQYTQLDELGAGLGSMAMLQALLKQFQEDSGLKEAVEKINEAIDKQDAASDMDKHTDEINKLLAEARNTADKAGQILAGMPSKLRQAADVAASKAVAEVEDSESVIISWGLNKGEFMKLPYTKKLEILKVLRCQKKFRDMTKLVGRMRNLAVASRKAKLEQQRVELHSITLGDDINRVLPQELVALRRSTLKLDFYRRMMEKQLLQYDLNHNDCAGQGPIIALIDTSGSMRKDHREEWSKAVAMGLAEIASREKRSFAYALFGSVRDELITDEFLSGQWSPDKLLRLATEFIGGGTDYKQPLKWAMDKLNESKYNKADIVIITDGECLLDDAFLAELTKVKSDKDFRIYSILIGSTPYELQRWSDDVWAINDLLDDSVINEVFAKI